MGRIIEGFWDCEYCGTKGIRGSIEKCPKCGGVHNTENGFYLKPNELNYVPEEEAKNINRNPDWVCDFCGNLNSDDFESCPSCGAPRTKENLNYFESRAKKEKEKAEKELQNKAYSNTQHDSSRESEKSYAVSKPSNSVFKRVLIVLASILLVAGIIFVCMPKEQEIHVQEVSWKYSINIEEFKTVTENDIYLPTDARLLYTTQEISYYEDVLDHYETKTREVQKERIVGYEEYVTGYNDLGNGYFEEITATRPIYETYYETETYEEPIYRQEPVYRTRYFYEIDKWVYVRSIDTSGKTKETFWGEPSLSQNERISSKDEHYYVSGLNTKTDKETKLIVSFDDWNLINVDNIYKFKVSLGYGELIK